MFKIKKNQLWGFVEWVWGIIFGKKMSCFLNFLTADIQPKVHDDSKTFLEVPRILFSIQSKDSNLPTSSLVLVFHSNLKKIINRALPTDQNSVFVEIVA